MQAVVGILKAFGKSTAENPDLTSDKAEVFSDTLVDKNLACAKTVRDLGEKIMRLNWKIYEIQNSKVGAAFTKTLTTVLADEDYPA